MTDNSKKTKELQLLINDIDKLFARYIAETGDIKVSGLMSKIIAKAHARFPEELIFNKND